MKREHTVGVTMRHREREREREREKAPASSVQPCSPASKGQGAQPSGSGRESSPERQNGGRGCTGRQRAGELPLMVTSWWVFQGVAMRERFPRTTQCGGAVPSDPGRGKWNPPERPRPRIVQSPIRHQGSGVSRVVRSICHQNRSKSIKIH